MEQFQVHVDGLKQVRAAIRNKRRQGKRVPKRLLQLRKKLRQLEVKYIQTKRGSKLTQLPNEIVAVVLSYLNAAELGRLCIASRHLSFDVDLYLPKQLRYVQVVIVLDTTGSMGHVIQQVKDFFISFLPKLQETYPQHRFEFGFLGYTDFDGEAPLFQSKVGSGGEILEKLATVDAKGGGDTPEAVRTALSEVPTVMKWRRQATKLAILLADAPPHANSSPDSQYYQVEQAHLGKEKADWVGLCNRIAEKNIRCLPIAIGHPAHTDLLLRFNSVLATLTKGLALSITPTDIGKLTGHLVALVGSYVTRGVSAPELPDGICGCVVEQSLEGILDETGLQLLGVLPPKHLRHIRNNKNGYAPMRPVTATRSVSIGLGTSGVPARPKLTRMTSCGGTTYTSFKSPMPSSTLPTLTEESDDDDDSDYEWPGTTAPPLRPLMHMTRARTVGALRCSSIL
jgi:hypothetical protein